MRTLDLISPQELDDQGLSKSSAGARWDLSDEAFLRWWQSLPEEDRSEFVSIYGGDEALARFVCALDYLTTMQARPQTGQTIVEAYAIASNKPSQSDEARRGALTAWGHDAVQALIDRLRYRSAKQAAARITNRATLLIEDMLAQAKGDDVSIRDKATAVKAAVTFMKMVSDEDIQERVERTRRGFERARAQLVSVDAEEVLTEEQAALHLKVLRSQLGEEGFQKALNA